MDTFLDYIKRHGMSLFGVVVQTSPSKAGGVGSILGWGTKIPHASWPKKKKPEAMF